MIDIVKNAYKYDEWVRKFTVSQSFIEIENFIRSEDCLGFEPVSKEIVFRDSNRRMVCTIWQNSVNPDQRLRLMIDLYENDSFEESKLDMLEILTHTDRVPLLKGPEDIGDISFECDNNKAPIVYWILDRFLMAVKSFGADPANVNECAYRISTRLKDALHAKKI